jgi:hypothetical protein
MSIKQQNINLLAHVADRLDRLREEVVFLGGTETVLLLSEFIAIKMKNSTAIK